VLVLESEIWLADDGNVEVEYDYVADGAEAAAEYVSEGEYGNGGGSVSVCTWRAGLDHAGDEVRVDEEWHDVDLPVDHAALIREAGGDPDCEHEWTSEGMGGCNENPGVWATGGTSMLFSQRCTRCGVVRHEHWAGSQKNPGQADSEYTYEIPTDD
jgi:hypothetical protein